MTTDPLQAAPLMTAKHIVNEQADDDGLWFVAETAAEAYLQSALRRLHEAVEGKTAAECIADLFTPPASVVSAPAPGEDDLAYVISNAMDNTLDQSDEYKIARAILAAGYRKSLPSVEVVELREALRPFAELGRELGDGVVQGIIWKDDEAIKGVCAYRDGKDYNITLGDLRRAAKALHPTPTAPPKPAMCPRYTSEAIAHGFGCKGYHGRHDSQYGCSDEKCPMKAPTDPVSDGTDEFLELLEDAARSGWPVEKGEGK